MADKGRDAPERGTDTLRARLIRHAKGPKGLPSIGRELAYAVTDIRQKVVEEATYGRAVTPQPLDAGGIHGKARPAEAEEPDKGDPLGRSATVSVSASFRARCAEVAERGKGRDGPSQERPGPSHEP